MLYTDLRIAPPLAAVLVMAAVGTDPRALGHAAEDIQRCREVVMICILVMWDQRRLANTRSATSSVS